MQLTEYCLRAVERVEVDADANIVDTKKNYFRLTPQIEGSYWSALDHSRIVDDGDAGDAPFCPVILRPEARMVSMCVPGQPTTLIAHSPLVPIGRRRCHLDLDHQGRR